MYVYFMYRYGVVYLVTHFLRLSYDFVTSIIRSNKKNRCVLYTFVLYLKAQFLIRKTDIGT